MTAVRQAVMAASRFTSRAYGKSAVRKTFLRGGKRIQAQLQPSSYAPAGMSSGETPESSISLASLARPPSSFLP